MTGRNGLRLAGGIVVGGLLLEVGWAIADRLHLQLVDRGIRVLDHVCDVARM